LARADQNARPAGRQLLQMQARAFIGTVLAPHHREDAELCFGRFAPQDRANFLQLEGRQLTHAVAATSEFTMLSKITRPSAEPTSGSEARSGCGIRPITLRRSLQIPAMSRSDPFGLST